MELGLQGKVAIITGGAQGIGRTIASILTKEGAKIVVADINKQNADNVVKEVTDLGGEALAIIGDVRNLTDTDRLAAETLRHFGSIDILVHNASLFSIKPFLDTPPETWLDIIGVGQIGAFNCCKSVLPQMIRQQSGRVIFIGSDAGRVGDSYQPIYASGKAGIVAFCKSLAQDMGPKGITVNVVSPALTMTEENRAFLEDNYKLADERRASKLYHFYPMRRIGNAADVANTVVFLSSDKASFITGQTISVNGGYCML